MNKNNIKGITLIALIITIIVLLILAGISITTLAGENGLINKTIKAKNITEKAEAEEAMRLAYMDAYIGSYSGESESLAKKIEKELEEKYGEGNVTVTDGSGNSYIVEIEEIGTYTIDKNGEVSEYKNVKISYEIAQEDGTSLESGVTYDNALVKIKISNKDEFDEIKTIKFYKDDEEIEAEEIDLENGVATFKVSSNRTYKATTNAIAEEITYSNSKNVTVKNIITAQPFNRYWKEGKIDVVWLNTSNQVISAPNTPNLTIKDTNGTEYGLTPVEYDANVTDRWADVTDTSSTWYEYIAQSSKIANDGTGTSKWANARAKDGSLFVWIPRYAYKITYYDQNDNEIGYSTNAGIIDPNGHVISPADSNYSNNEKVQTEGYTDYIVHPAFSIYASNGGGWSNELSGFWFGKFESSNNGGEVKVAIGTQSWRSIYINAMYNYAQLSTYGGSNNGTNILQSHMVKNSEWGAVAYLAHSKYGLNGGKVMKNSSIEVPGNSTSVSNVYGNNVYQSTTHNQYGIYDMNGGAYEWMASYVNNGHPNLTSYGNYGDFDLKLYGTTENQQETSTKFKTVYPSSVKDGSNANAVDYEKSSKIKGDAVYETSSSYSYDMGSWHSASASYPYNTAPFFSRSGYGWGNNGGTFYYSGTTGKPEYSNFGFRIALCFSK